MTRVSMLLWFAACGDKPGAGAQDSGAEAADGADGTGGADGTDGTDPDDADGDGFRPEDGDCDDDDATKFPFDRTASGGDAGCGHRVALGTDFLCALDSGGAVSCRDITPLDISLDEGQTAAPGGAFVELSSGTFHACARDAAGTVSCWGWDLYGQASPPGGTFAAIDAGAYLSCGLLDTTEVACWGGFSSGVTPAPPGAFLAVDAGLVHACGVRVDGRLACWAPDGIDVADPPEGEGFRDVAVGGQALACALDEVGAVTCWGDAAAGLGALPLSGVTQLDLTTSNTLCMLRDAGGLLCVGDAPLEDPGPYQQIDAEGGRVCVVDEAGAIRCTPA